MYLITDPVDAQLLDYYNVEIDGELFKADGAHIETSGDSAQKRLHFMLPPLPDGQHTARVQPMNAWAPGVWSDPLSFTSLGPPPPVTGLALSAE